MKECVMVCVSVLLYYCEAGTVTLSKYVASQEILLMNSFVFEISLPHSAHVINPML